MNTQDYYRVLGVDQNVDAAIEGFDIFNGRIGLGGGVFLDTGSDSIIQGNRIYSNSVFGGGGNGYQGGRNQDFQAGNANQGAQ